MSFEISPLAHLTGSVKVTENHFSFDEVILSNKSRTVRQMFFQPYESKKEFIFCLRNTLLPMTLIGLAVLDPIIAGLTIVGVLFVAAVCAAIGGISKLCGKESNASSFLDTAKSLIDSLSHALIKLVALPLSVLVMVTRGISTGLHAAGIGKEQEEVPSPSH